MKSKKVLTGSLIGLLCLSMISMVPSNADKLPFTAKDILNLKNNIFLGRSSAEYDVDNDGSNNVLDLVNIKKEIFDNTTTADSSNSKILVVYYSLPKGDTIDSDGSASRVYSNGQTMGSVEYMAKTIQEATGADTFKIETEQVYPDYYDELVSQAQDEQNNNYRPTLSTHIENIDQYDTIFIGYPNWWGDMPMAVYSFFDEYNLDNKTIIPFNSHGGSRFSSTIDTIKSLEPNANVLDNGLTISRSSVESSKDTIVDWVNGLNLPKDDEKSKVLVAYMSYPLSDGTDASTSASRVVVDGDVVGTTEYFADIIQQYTNGDMFRIKAKDPYSDDFNTLADRALKEQQDGTLPELEGSIQNLDDYDTIFIGYPIWWYDMPQLMYSFFEQYDFSGKNIVLFNTHGGSRFSGTVETIQSLEPNANISEDNLTIARERVVNSKDDIIQWLDGLNI